MPSEKTFPALAALLAPFPVSTFFAEHWERTHLHVARAGAPPLLTIEELDTIITTGAHRHPDLSLVDASREVKVEDYATADGLVDTARAIKRFGEGASIVLNRLDEWSPRVRELCARLEAELGMVAQANLYLTLGGAQGFPVHYDNHDVVIVQCAGRKAWRLYDSPVGLPMRGERFDREVTSAGPLSATVETGPGDALYIPRGLMHEAVADEKGTSLHVTVGLHAVRWSEVVVEAVARASLEDPRLREGIPPGVLVGRGDDVSLDEALRAHIERVARAVRWAPLRERLIERFHNDHKESLGGMLTRVASPPDADATFEARPGVLAFVEVEDDAAVLTVNGRSTRWPAHAESTLRRALALPRFRLEDLGEALDLRGRLTLARRLVIEGAVKVVEAASIP